MYNIVSNDPLENFLHILLRVFQFSFIHIYIYFYEFSTNEQNKRYPRV